MKDTQGIRGGTWREESTDAGYVKSFEE
jgi:hypothetical protein